MLPLDQQALTAFFEDLHRHPELGLEEKRTTEKIRSALDEAGIPHADAGMDVGLVAIIRGRLPGRVIGLRCDIDALPIQEETGLPYASCEAGKMHACGHDFHTAVMLGAALLLKEKEDSLAGTVKIVFQPAEEISQGGLRFAGSGLVDDAEEFYAVHSFPGLPAGTLGIKEGPVMAAPDRFAITLRGRGAHAAYPHKGADPIPAAAALVLSLQSIISRSLNPFTPAVLSVTHLSAGNTWNVIPEEAFLEGTVRTMDVRVRESIHASMARMAQSIAAAHGCQAKLAWWDGPDPVINDAALCAAAREIALETGFAVARQEDVMGGEDFSEYLKKCPGVFIRVGTGGEYPAHHPKFTVDPAVLHPAARFFACLAARRAAAGT